jgi:hypothetical protein
VEDEQQMDPVDRRLAELGRATEPIRARHGFAERVMLAAAAEIGWQPEVLRSARRLLPIAALAAVLATSWALWTQSSTDAMIAAADETEEELDW